MNDNIKYWCAFARLVKVGSAFVSNLYSHFGAIDIAWNASRSDLYQVKGINSRQINDFLEEKKNINPDKTFDYIQKRGFDFICPEDKRYPYLLRFIDNSPIGLFVSGRIDICNLKRTLAVVGSRRASENGKRNLSNLLKGFYGTDICIVSGMAEGIDTVAHRSAIDNNLKTIAVIGGGFDKIYPKSNIKLFHEITEGNGAVLSEYWINEDAISWHFPVRNRIVSGLSKGVLVAEATLKSGAMITANLALEQNRELMCMPGTISNPNTQGIYKLVKDGAPIVTNADDIMNILNWKIMEEKSFDNSDNQVYSENEMLILDLLKKDTLSLDEIALKTNLNINDLMVILTKLEMNGTIIQTTGERYTCFVNKNLC